MLIALVVDTNEGLEWARYYKNHDDTLIAITKDSNMAMALNDLLKEGQHKILQLVATNQDSVKSAISQLPQSPDATIYNPTVLYGPSLDVSYKPKAIQVSIVVCFDSLGGFEPSLKHAWNNDLHRGKYNHTLQNAFQKQAFYRAKMISNEIAGTFYLKRFFGEISINCTYISRTGLNLAHANPMIDKTQIQHQLSGKRALLEIADHSTPYDLLMTNLGTNDMQDYNTLAIEKLLKLMPIATLQRLLIGNPDQNLKKKLLDSHQYLMENEAQSLIPKYIFSKLENVSVYAALKLAVKELKKDSSLSQDQINAINWVEYYHDWKEKSFSNKIIDEIFEDFDNTLSEFQYKQQVESRGFPLQVAFIKPPLYTEPGLWPSFHTLRNIKALREGYEQYANKNNHMIFDTFEEACQSLRDAKKEPLVFDRIHFRNKTFAKIAKIFPFSEIFHKTVCSKMYSIFHQSKIPAEQKEDSVANAVTAELKHLQSTNTRFNLFAKALKSFLPIAHTQEFKNHRASTSPHNIDRGA